MSRAFQDVFSIADAFRSVPMPGRTDAGILSDAAAIHGIAPSDELFGRFHDVYLGHLRLEIEQPGPRKGIMPGVRPLLDALEQRGDVYLALLTGNYEAAARVKLEYFDLWRYFRCGAFGDAARDRNGLFPRAVSAIRSRGGPETSPSDVFVVGDTPLDVACAAASGAVSVAVATGGYDVDALQAAGADFVFRDLSETAHVLELMTGIERQARVHSARADAGGGTGPA
jgi:phosphoglycolate phosphatase